MHKHSIKILANVAIAVVVGGDSQPAWSLADIDNALASTLTYFPTGIKNKIVIEPCVAPDPGGIGNFTLA